MILIFCRRRSILRKWSCRSRGLFLAKRSRRREHCLIRRVWSTTTNSPRWKNWSVSRVSCKIEILAGASIEEEDRRHKVLQLHNYSYSIQSLMPINKPHFFEQWWFGFCSFHRDCLVVPYTWLLSARVILPFLLTSSLLGRSFLISNTFLISVFCCHPVPVAPSVFRCPFHFCHSLLDRSFLFLLEVSIGTFLLDLSSIGYFGCYASYLTAPSAEIRLTNRQWSSWQDRRCN